MTPPRFAPAEISLPFADGEYLFKLPLLQVAQLQERRGWKMTWADGSTGVRPKPLGMIWREVAGSGDYDLLDCVEIIRLGLVGGAQGLVNGEPVKVTVMSADQLIREYVARPATTEDPGALLMPAEQVWLLASQVLMATCQGYAPPGPPPDQEDTPQGNGDAAGKASSTSPQPTETEQSGA